MFTIGLYINNSEEKKVNKDLTLIASIEGELRGECSVLSPTIRIEYDGDLSRCNYMIIGAYNRFYFVTDINIVRTGVYEISGRVDVLTTYKDELLQNRAIIKKSERKWNTYLDDGTFHTYSTPFVTQKKFPSGFSGSSFVLAVLGS